MKIILDARKIEDYGIGTYIQNLFPGIAHSGLFDCRTVHLRGTTHMDLPPESYIAVSSKNYDWREHLEIPFKTNRMKDFYYFSPHYVFPLFIKNKLIITVHDLIHFKFPDLFKPAVRVELGKFFMRQVKRRAILVFTVSQTTKQDLQEIFGFEDQRVKVIYNGVSEFFFQRTPQISGFAFPYVLYTGNLKPHKNLPTLLKAFSLVKERFSELRLVLVGVNPDKPFCQLMRDLEIKQRIVIKGYQPQESVIRFLDGAEFFVFPSLYEGFGLPPLEAMARRKAVISSSGGSLSEILGDSALYFRPDSAEELAERISLFMEDRELREDYENRGFEHSAKFRWETTIKEYLGTLETLKLSD
jgi:glycosyltransferase involved in cell wall biosynthesis